MFSQLQLNASTLIPKLTTSSTSSSDSESGISVSYVNVGFSVADTSSRGGRVDRDDDSTSSDESSSASSSSTVRGLYVIPSRPQAKKIHLDSYPR